MHNCSFLGVMVAEEDLQRHEATSRITGCCLSTGGILNFANRNVRPPRFTQKQPAQDGGDRDPVIMCRRDATLVGRMFLCFYVHRSRPVAQ